jgi:hypothetical protein
MGRVGVFLAATLYGASWIAAAINLVAIVVSLGAGQEVVGFLPVLLASLGVILYIHHLAGWPPFGRRNQPHGHSNGRGSDR